MIVKSQFCAFLLFSFLLLRNSLCLKCSSVVMMGWGVLLERDPRNKKWSVFAVFSGSFSQVFKKVMDQCLWVAGTIFRNAWENRVIAHASCLTVQCCFFHYFVFGHDKSRIFLFFFAECLNCGSEVVAWLSLEQSSLISLCSVINKSIFFFLEVNTLTSGPFVSRLLVTLDFLSLYGFGVSCWVVLAVAVICLLL